MIIDNGIKTICLYFLSPNLHNTFLLIKKYDITANIATMILQIISIFSSVTYDIKSFVIK